MVKMTEEIVKCTHLPVTVKTRLGWDDNTKNIVEVAERLQDIGIKALTIHGRTRVQMYKGSADWRLIAAIKNNQRMRIPVFGNGDVDSPQKALEYRNKFGVDGIMIGRAAIGYPWIFNEIKEYFKHGERPAPPDMMERIRVAKKHLEFSIRWKGDWLGIVEMRRHYANYFKGIPDFKPFRGRLVEAETVDEVINILDDVTAQYSMMDFSTVVND
jgi:nifR3 family TIM-barrel protein